MEFLENSNSESNEIFESFEGFSDSFEYNQENSINFCNILCSSNSNVFILFNFFGRIILVGRFI
jgi:hypothetical protein